jgi:hypothetical protein
MANTNVCGPFSQTLFLGASIISFSASLGWNGDQGRLTVQLVEDTCIGEKVYYDANFNPRIATVPDFFNPPKIGSPVYFKFGSFSFGGILQGWEEEVDVKGGKIFVVKITDALEIVEGTQVIINNYTGGTFGVPNLINAFGYNESLFSACGANASLTSLDPPLKYIPAAGFGGANVSADGMSWYQIRDAIQLLSNIPNTSFGGLLSLRDHRYFIDISELPSLDANFRFNGDSVTILEAISQVCAAAGADFFTELLLYPYNYVNPNYSGIAGHVHQDILKIIKIRVVSRFYQKTSANNVDLTVGSNIDARLNLGRITQFVGDGTGRLRSSRGLEFRNDITNSFLVGDNRQDLWMQAYTGSANGYTDTIWPFWGKDSNGVPIIGTGINNDHTFNISTSTFGQDLINILGATYNLKMIEMRCALSGLEEWSMYMYAQKTAIAQALELDASFTSSAISALSAANKPPKPDDLKTTSITASRIANKHAGNDPDIDYVELQRRLYEIVRSYAELAGKKFMVALPLICTSEDTSAPFSIKMNWEPSDGGWTDADVQIHPSATPLQQDSPILELLRLDDGRIQSFVYFNTGNPSRLIDYSQLSPDEVIPLNDTSCYIKANVEEIIFLNPTAMTYPRAIVSINSLVTIKGDSNGELDAKIIDSLFGWLTNVPREWLDKKSGIYGDDTNKLSLFPMPIVPLGAAVPLRSTTLSYGPWITTFNFGPAAKTLYERDTSLSPWAFGNTSTMNYAGQIKVESQVTQQIVNEAGSITIPGAPPGRLGDVLIVGGPEVTQINVEISPNGVTSGLQMRTWIPNFGEIGRRRIQALRNAGTYQQKLQRAFLRKRGSDAQAKAISNLTRPLLTTDRFNRHSSHNIIAGQLVEDYKSAGNYRTNVVLTDTRKVLPEAYADYKDKAFMEMGGLFRPFSTSGYPGILLPAFSSYIPSNTNITALALNPFKTSEKYFGTSQGHDIEMISRGTGIDDINDFSVHKAETYGPEITRGIGLRAPVVLVGWGYDLNGKPVPNKTPNNPTNNFADDYLRKTNLWKAGPLDVRWDDSRGVWSAAGTTFRIAYLDQNLYTGYSAYGRLVSVTTGNLLVHPQFYNNPGLNYNIDSGNILIFDGLKIGQFGFPGYPSTPSGAFIYVCKEQTSNQYFMIGAAVW